MNYKVITRIEELPTFNPELPLFCDIESDGLYINTRLIQYYQPETSEDVYILDVDYFGEHTTDAGTQNSLFKALGKTKEIKVTREQVKKLHSDKWLVWWNGSYDQGTLGFGSKKVDDLWYMAKIGLPKLDAFNLDVVTDYLFPGKNFYKGLDKKALQKARFKPGVLSEAQLRYSATDVYVMKFLWDKLYPKLKDNRAYQIDILNLGYAVDWQQCGLKVNQKLRDKEEIKYKQMLMDTHEQFPVDINVNSYQQVRALLAATDEGWNIDTNYDWEQAKARHKANPIVTASDETALLTRAAEGCPYSKLILEERGILKTLNFLSSYNRDKVYGNFNPYGTKSGRWSCKGGDREGAVNMQQLPRKLKHIFGFEEDDERVFVGGDLPTAELRLIAAVYGEKTMADAFANNIDLHTLTASKTTGKTLEDVSPGERKKAKAENFGLCYGMGAETFQSYAFKNYGIVMTLEEATKRRNNWMQTYSDQARVIETIKKDFFNDKGNYVVKTLLNRWVKPDMYTDAVNIPIQGGIAEVTKLWIHYVVTMNKEDKNLKLRVANFVHDSLSLECYKHEAEYWQDILIKACDKAWKYYMSLPGIKINTIEMPVKVGISNKYQGVS